MNKFLSIIIILSSITILAIGNECKPIVIPGGVKEAMSKEYGEGRFITIRCKKKGGKGHLVFIPDCLLEKIKEEK